MDAAILLRFDEPATEVLPSDDAGALKDMRNDGSTTLPEVVEGVVGHAREFVAGDATALKATDEDAGASLFTRTVSVQALVRWDFDDQVAAGTAGVIICRGKRGSSSERVAYGLELRVVNAGARVGEVRLFWEDLAGARYNAVGGQFRLARGREQLMITAVRRWSATRDIVVRYYLGDVLLNEATATRFDIGGGTTGTTTIGARITDGGTTWADHFDGAIDELRVLGRELVAEEVAMTYRRIRDLQPKGEQLLRDCMPPGLPITDDPDSRVQREIRWMGHALGFAAAQIENSHANLIPTRAYGRVLDRWEGIARTSSRPSDDVDVRRARVVAHFARRLGVSPPGVRDALKELLACAPEQLQIRAFDNTIRDGFDSLVAARWMLSPAAHWSVAAGKLHVLAANGSDAAFHTTWRTALTGVDGPERAGGFGAQLFAKLEPTSIPDGGEAGLVLYDWCRRDALMLGLRRDGADYKVVSQKFLGGVAAVATEHATTALVPHWLHLYAVPVSYSGQARDAQVAHAVRWSTTSAATGFTAGDPGTFSFSVGWAGFYARAWNNAALAGDLEVNFDDAAFRFPNGIRPFAFFVVRDPNLPGEYDLLGAHAVLKKLRHRHTYAGVCTGPMRAGDPIGLAPCGGV